MADTFQLHVSLSYFTPSIWRRLEVPADYSFYQLHMAIQAAFGWKNAHLFQFSKRGIVDDDPISIPFEDAGRDLQDARTISINTIFKSKGDKYVYVYDFGDEWVHKIKLEAIADKKLLKAVCVAGKNECPPEDVGGMYGYGEMLECFESGSKTEKKKYTDWLGLKPDGVWDKTYFNIVETNNRLAQV